MPKIVLPNQMRDALEELRVALAERNRVWRKHVRKQKSHGAQRATPKEGKTSWQTR